MLQETSLTKPTLWGFKGHRGICGHVVFVSCQLHLKTPGLPPADKQFPGHVWLGGGRVWALKFNIWKLLLETRELLVCYNCCKSLTARWFWSLGTTKNHWPRTRCNEGETLSTLQGQAEYQTYTHGSCANWQSWSKVSYWSPVRWQIWSTFLVWSLGRLSGALVCSWWSAPSCRWRPLCTAGWDLPHTPPLALLCPTLAEDY